MIPIYTYKAQMMNDAYETCSEVLDVFTPSQRKKALLLPHSILAPRPTILLFTLDQLWCSSEPVQLINPAKSQIVIFWGSNEDWLSEEPSKPRAVQGEVGAGARVRRTLPWP